MADAPQSASASKAAISHAVVALSMTDASQSFFEKPAHSQQCCYFVLVCQPTASNAAHPTAPFHHPDAEFSATIDALPPSGCEDLCYVQPNGAVHHPDAKISAANSPLAPSLVTMYSLATMYPAIVIT